MVIVKVVDVVLALTMCLVKGVLQSGIDHHSEIVPQIHPRLLSWNASASAAGRSLANREPAGGYGGKPRDTPFSSTAFREFRPVHVRDVQVVVDAHSSMGHAHLPRNERVVATLTYTFNCILILVLIHLP